MASSEDLGSSGTLEAFFQRCRDLRPAFSAEIFRHFTARLVAAISLATPLPWHGAGPLHRPRPCGRPPAGSCG